MEMSVGNISMCHSINDYVITLEHGIPLNHFLTFIPRFSILLYGTQRHTARLLLFVQKFSNTKMSSIYFMIYNN